jgi:hypothetical protein
MVCIGRQILVDKPSPLSPFVAEAGLEGYHWDRGQGPRPFHGYFFKILTRQGPGCSGRQDELRPAWRNDRRLCVGRVSHVRWGESGIMTFMVNQDGIVYQRSLGEKTARFGRRHDGV